MRRAILFSVCLLLLNACKEQPQSTPYASDKPFAGQSIVVMVPKLDSIRNNIFDEKLAFEKETGARVQVVTPSWQDAATKLRESLQEDGQFDIYMMIAMWNSELLAGHHIAAIPDDIKKTLDWDDVLPIYRDTVLSWDGVAYGYPYDGDSVNLYYRADLFNDVDNQQQFLKQYGYALQAPQTWNQLKDAAAFFTGKDWDKDGKPNYGMVGVRAIHTNEVQQFFSQAAAYAKHPDDPAYFFDVATMQPKINTAGFVKALQIWVDTMQYGPPQMINMSSLDARSSFISGQAAMMIDWTDTPVHAANSKNSKVKNKLGYAQLPASEQVYNANTKQWDKQNNQVTSISGNWVLLVHSRSKHKELAMKFASYMSSKEMTTKLMADSNAVVNPSRYSHFKNLDVWQKAGFEREDAQHYLDAILQSLNNPNRMYDLNIPYASDYYKAMDVYVNRALRKEITPQQALDMAANDWNNITDKVGRAKQAEYYRASLNLTTTSQY